MMLAQNWQANDQGRKNKRCQWCGWISHKWISRKYVKFNWKKGSKCKKNKKRKDEENLRELRREDASCCLYYLQTFDLCVCILGDWLVYKDTSINVGLIWPSNNRLSSWLEGCLCGQATPILGLWLLIWIPGSN
jgi:hypothetical protein